MSSNPHSKQSKPNNSVKIGKLESKAKTLPISGVQSLKKGSVSALQITKKSQLNRPSMTVDFVNRSIDGLTSLSPSLDELAAEKNTELLIDVRSLFGTWPGDSNDDFELSIEQLRHPERFAS